MPADNGVVPACDTDAEAASPNGSSTSMDGGEESSTVRIEGELYVASYLGSTQLVSEGRPTKALRMLQAQVKECEKSHPCPLPHMASIV